MEKICISTVSSTNFLPGTLVLIHSFLRHNPWFNGEIIIIYDDLDATQKQQFGIFQNVVFKKTEDDLLLKIGQLCWNRRKLLPQRRHFYSIEAFGMEGYDRLLFFDSDMLVTGDLNQVVKLPGELLACSDSHYERLDEVRDRTTFERISANSVANQSKVLTKTFNSGFMAVGKSYLNNKTYEALKQLIHINIFSEITTHNTDQVVLNLLFDGMVTYLPATYNLILSQSPELILKNKLNRDEIKVLHFTGKYKPWIQSSKLDELLNDPYYEGFIRLWESEWKEVKKKLEGQ